MSRIMSRLSANIGSLFALLSSWRDCFPLLYPIDWTYRGFVGTYNLEFDRTCRHVLVLLPSCEGDSHLVEGMDYQTPNHTVHY